MTDQERAYYQSVEDGNASSIADVEEAIAHPVTRDWARIAEMCEAVGVQDALAHWPLRGHKDHFANGDPVYVAWYAPLSGCMTQGDTPEEALEELYEMMPTLLRHLARGQ